MWHVVKNPMRDDGWFVVRDRTADEKEAYAGQMLPAIVGHQLSLSHANLIAAAPDLLDALKAVLTVLQKEAPGTSLNSHKYDVVGAQARAAVAKAEGR